jgi:hypothetical protein
MIGKMTLNGSNILLIFILYRTGIKLKKLGENGIKKIRILLLILIMMRVLLNQKLNANIIISIIKEEINKDFIDNFSSNMSNKIQQELIQLVRLISMIIIQN